MGCGKTMLKVVIWMANITVFGSGAVLLGLSLWANLDSDASDEFNKFTDVINGEHKLFPLLFFEQITCDLILKAYLLEIFSFMIF